jgi:hypothetical protein
MQGFGEFARCAILIGVAFAVSHATAYADITYDIDLDNILGPEGGAGSFDVVGPIASSGLWIAGPSSDGFSGDNVLTALTLTIDGKTFSLADAQNALTSVTFFNGSLINLSYVGKVGSDKVTLDSAFGYVFKDKADHRENSVGIIKSALVPEPWSVALLGTALLIVGFSKRKVFGRGHLADPRRSS